MLDIIEGIVLSVGVLFAVYSVLINTSFLVLTGLALFDLGSYRRRLDFAAYDETFSEPLARSISVLMPAYNESVTIVDAVTAMMALRYPDFEVIVIDDGSKDDTVTKLVETFDMVRVPLVASGTIENVGGVHCTWVSRRGGMNLLLVCKENGGKADALNAGINHARNELVCMVDADSILDPDSLLHVSRPFADDPGRVVASGGVIRVANGSTITGGRVVKVQMPRAWLTRIQVVEYVRAFLVGRAGWSATGGLLIISGAFGLFRKDVVVTVGGMATDCIGEDAELVVRIHRWLGDQGKGGRVVFVTEPVAWTEAPESRSVLRRQRRRWHRGLAEIFARHKAMVLRRRYGVIGMLTMPWFLAFELMAPLVEVLGLAYFAVVVVLLALENLGVMQGSVADVELLVLLLTTSVLYAVFVTLMALVAEELSFRRYRGLPDLFRAVWAAFEENVGYRQLNSWWHLGGMVEALRRSRHDWGDMERKGFGES